MKARYLTLPIAALLLAGCASNTPEPTPTASETHNLTELQQHIKEDAIIELEKQAISKQGVIDYLAKEYPIEDVKAGVSAMACEADWTLEATQKLETLGVDDKAAAKSRLLDEGFTEEEAEFAVNAPKQNT